MVVLKLSAITSLVPKRRRGHATSTTDNCDDKLSTTSVDLHSKAPNVSETATESDQSHEPVYPTGWQLWFIMTGLCLGVFCVALDTTIIATALPRITDHFHDLQDIGWYGSAYVLTICAFQLMFGKFYGLFGIKQVYLSALAIFELGSLICGVAPNSVTLISGRAVAGVGSAGIYSGAMTIIAHSAPIPKRPVLQSSIGAVFAIASVLGPLLGGFLTDRASWRWCFWVNLPIGLITAIILLLKLDITSTPPERKAFTRYVLDLDPVGTALFIPSIVSLLLALQWGGTTYAWSSGRIIALFIVFTVLLIAFIGVQIYLGDSAAVPLRIVTQRTIAAVSFFNFCLSGVRFMLLYLLPIWFQAILGLSAFRSGIATIPLVLSHCIAILIAGRLMMIYGQYMPWVYLCVVLTSVGCGLFYTLSPSSKAAAYIGYQIVYAVGTGCAFQVPQISAQVVLEAVSPQPRTDIPMGIAVTLFSQYLGAAVLISVANNVLDVTLVRTLTASITAPGFDAAQVVKMGATQLRQQVPAMYLDKAIDAYNTALTRAFLIAVIVSCIGALGAAAMEWKSLRPSGPVASTARKARRTHSSEKA